MPRGTDIDEIEPALRTWVPDLAEDRRMPFGWPRRFLKWFCKWFCGDGMVAPLSWRHTPGIARIRFGSRHA